jgi:hypothetical protein
MQALRFHPVLAFEQRLPQASEATPFFERLCAGAVPSDIVVTAMRSLSKGAQGKAARRRRIRPAGNDSSAASILTHGMKFPLAGDGLAGDLLSTKEAARGRGPHPLSGRVGRMGMHLSHVRVVDIGSATASACCARPVAAEETKRAAD